MGVYHNCERCNRLISLDYQMCEICASISKSDETEGDGGVSGALSLSIRRRYAKAKSVFEVGIWSVKSVDCLMGIMIGSSAGIRNSYKELRLDNRRLRFELSKMGLEYADCFCGELSPESHEFIKRDGSRGVTVGSLWHNHGFFKLNERIGASELHSVLSPLWGNIHGSQVVDIKVIYEERKAISYAVKDAVKNYISDDGVDKRLMVSSLWLPKGYREVDKLLVKWALLHRYDWDVEQSEPNQGYAPRLEYVPFVWEQKRDYLRRWCHGESVNLDLGDYKVYIVGDVINKYAVKSSDVM